MDPATFIDPQLTVPDLLLLNNLLRDVDRQTGSKLSTQRSHRPNGHSNGAARATTSSSTGSKENADAAVPDLETSAEIDDLNTLTTLQELNTAGHSNFEPTVFLLWDTKTLSPWVKSLLRPYISWAQNVARHPTDVVMINHLFLYFCTSLPSAVYLFLHFSWIHAFAHWFMQIYYVGTYTLMKHQHIHQGGILAKNFPYNVVDTIFPYITDPLMGHTWNSYYYHHVKHHHIEANGPDDLSSTIRYQRDDIFNLLHYIGRFFFLIYIDLPMYFISKGKYENAIKANLWETLNYIAIYQFAKWKFLPTLFVFILPFLLLRIGLMIGNWGQHAFVDEVDPNSDFRSSVTLIDVPSNRFCFNDGYHTSHHLNPRRHWRDHPIAFLKQKDRYSTEQALVFRNIDYLMITFRLMIKDYDHLAKCLVPIGDQIPLSMKERADMLRTKTRRFTEEEIKAKFA